MPEPFAPIAVVTPFVVSAAAAAPQPDASWIVTLLVGGLGGGFATWIWMRSVEAKRSARIAREIDRIGAGATEEGFHRLQATLPETWQELAAAGRRAVREVAALESSLGSRVRDLEAILHSTASGFIAIDPTQRVLDLNPAAAEWLHVTRELGRGRLVQEIARHPELNRFLNDAVDRHESLERTIRLQGPPERELRVLSEPLRDPSGRSLGLLLSLQDVTQLRRLELLRSEFVANVSHELRTPITSIKGYIETLLQVGTEDPARVRKFIEIVHRNTVRLSNLVEDLLALASIEQIESNDVQRLEMIELPAMDVVREVASLLGPTAEAKRIHLDIKGDPEVRVRANRTLAEQAISNLLANAIRYSPEGTTVTLGVRAVGEECELSVRDEGPGIAKKHLDRIFERFYRVERSRTSASGGTGLGLAIVKHIAHAHGGHVDVVTEPGEGCCFTVRLPRVPTSAASAIPGL
jgi:two-component system phosphate regulon sensor histidine kinase PhoR